MPLSDWTTIRPDLEEELEGARAARAVVKRRLAALSYQRGDDRLAPLD